MTDTSQPIYASSALLFVGSTDVYTFFATGSDLLPVTAPGGTGTFKLYGLKDNYPSAAAVQFTRNLATVTSVGGLANGERASAAPSVAGDIVFYTTTVETASTPCADFSAQLYAVTYTGTRGLRLGWQRQTRQERESGCRDPVRQGDRAVHRRSAPLLRDNRGRADRTWSRSAIPLTSTTASGRLACASCRGGRFASEQAIARPDCVRIMRRQAAGRSSHLPALQSGGGRGARGAEDAVACQPADGARRGGGPGHRDNRHGERVAGRPRIGSAGDHSVSLATGSVGELGTRAFRNPSNSTGLQRPQLRPIASRSRRALSRTPTATTTRRSNDTRLRSRRIRMMRRP